MTVPFSIPLHNGLCRVLDRLTVYTGPMPKIEKFSTSTVTTESVLEAIAQFDRIGRHAFLEKFTMGRGAQRGNKGRRKGPYLVVYKGEQYDAYALAVAARFLKDPNRQRGLSSQEIEGPTEWLGYWTKEGNPRLGPTHWDSAIKTLKLLGFKIVS